MHHVTWDGGISLVGHDLWLDPPLVRDFAFVSHAHSDHTRRHGEALLTAATLALLPPPRRPRRWRTAALGEPVHHGEATLTLHDAGHILGSAQLLFDHGGARLLYTGDCKLRPLGRPRTPFPRADVLVIESTYGRPHLRFPDPDHVAGEVASWCRRALDQRVTPVLLTTALGKAQEMMLALGTHGFRFALEERCIPCAEAYEAAGTPLPDWAPLDVDGVDGRVVIAPPSGKDEVRRLERYRTALISGWAQEPTFWHRFGADYAFPFSDHCDFAELLEVVELCGAERVYTVHGFAADLARHLRRAGVRAHPLQQTEQLTLGL
jgi:DNA ligase-1